MATHSSVLAWRIPGTGEPGGLPSMGSHSRTRLKRLSSSSSDSIERVTGRKARVFKWRKEAAGARHFYLLSGRKKQTSDVSFLL